MASGYKAGLKTRTKHFKSTMSLLLTLLVTGGKNVGCGWQNLVFFSSKLREVEGIVTDGKLHE